MGTLFITHVQNCVMGARSLWAFTDYQCHGYWNLVYIFFSRTTAYGASNTAARVGSMIAPQIVFLVSTLKWCYWAKTRDFQQCDILKSVDSDEPVQPPFKLRNSKWCSLSSLTLIEYSNDKQRLWSDCAYAGRTYHIVGNLISQLNY